MEIFSTSKGDHLWERKYCASKDVISFHISPNMFPVNPEIWQIYGCPSPDILGMLFEYWFATAICAEDPEALTAV